MKSFATFLLGSSKKKEAKASSNTPSPSPIRSRHRSDSEPVNNPYAHNTHPPGRASLPTPRASISGQGLSFFKRPEFTKSTPRVDLTSTPSSQQPKSPVSSSTNDAVLDSFANLEIAFHSRRRSRSVGAQRTPRDEPIPLPPLPDIEALKIFKHTSHTVPQSLPATPATSTPKRPPLVLTPESHARQIPITPTPIARQASSSVSGPLASASRAKMTKRSLPELNGVWDAFLKEVEEDLSEFGVLTEKQNPEASRPVRPPSRALPPLPLQVRTAMSPHAEAYPLTPPITPSKPTAPPISVTQTAIARPVRPSTSNPSGTLPSPAHSIRPSISNSSVTLPSPAHSIRPSNSSVSLSSVARPIRPSTSVTLPSPARPIRPSTSSSSVTLPSPARPIRPSTSGSSVTLPSPARPIRPSTSGSPVTLPSPARPFRPSISSSSFHSPEPPTPGRSVTLPLPAQAVRPSTSESSSTISSLPYLYASLDGHDSMLLPGDDSLKCLVPCTNSEISLSAFPEPPPFSPKPAPPQTSSPRKDLWSNLFAKGRWVPEPLPTPPITPAERPTTPSSRLHKQPRPATSQNKPIHSYSSSSDSSMFQDTDDGRSSRATTVGDRGRSSNETYRSGSDSSTKLLARMKTPAPRRPLEGLSVHRGQLTAAVEWGYAI